MKYINKFSTSADYQAFTEGGGYVTPNICYVEESDGIVMKPYVKPPTPPYLIIEALEDGLTVSYDSYGCEYCVNGDYNWRTLATNEETESIAVGQTLYFKRVQVKGEGSGTFTISKKCNLNGNCMSMVFGDEAEGKTDLSEYPMCFKYLFDGCETIVSVNDDFLPATTLAPYCYSNMFRDCRNLIKAPKLPAIILAERCYEFMFNICPSLTTAPELPATTLAPYCYLSMFYSTSLTTAPELPATTLADGCYDTMFGSTLLTTAPELPATTLADGCYGAMFISCTSLTTAPELPATTLTEMCYAMMFQNCKNLNYIKMLATDITASMALTRWVKNVSSTGTFVKNTNMDTLPSGENGIPVGWTVVNETISM